MEFNFNINSLLGHEITRLDRNLTSSTRLSREQKAHLCEVIDKIGEASAKAQGLNGAITSAQKLRFSDHRVYVMRDHEANSAHGAVVGFIRVGHKRLFIYDHNGINHEMEPLCTLDFYVHESRQRTGCGRKLFEAMLQEEKVKPHQQAVDRPSHKFLSFLNKHYNLKSFVSQVNKFVVFDEFFRDKPANAAIDRRRSGQKPPLPLYHGTNSPDAGYKNSSSRPPSGSQVPLSELERQKEVLSNVMLPRQNSRESIRSASKDRHLDSIEGGANSMSPLAMGAQGTMYSRHINASMLPQKPTTQQKSPDTSSSPDKHNEPNNDFAIDVNKRVIGGLEPPLRQRDGPPSDYHKLYSPDAYNSHMYQDRHGHLKLAAHTGHHSGSQHGYTYQKSQSTSSVVNTTKTCSQQPSDPHKTSPDKPRTLGSAWNVFGVPPSPKYDSRNNSRYQQSRLW